MCLLKVKCKQEKTLYLVFFSTALYSYSETWVRRTLALKSVLIPSAKIIVHNFSSDLKKGIHLSACFRNMEMRSSGVLDCSALHRVGICAKGGISMVSPGEPGHTRLTKKDKNNLQPNPGQQSVNYFDTDED